MAERLTKKISKTIQDKYSLGGYLYYDFAEIDDTNKLLNKLGKLEDILEKHGTESVEELDKKIDDFTNFMKGNKFETIEDLQNALNGKFIEVFDEKNKIWQDMIKNLTKTEKERDTWERACELACEDKEIGIVKIINNTEIADLVRKNGDATLADYFYQQAKKEMER